jgi:hypothetical protein
MELDKWTMIAIATAIVLIIMCLYASPKGEMLFLSTQPSLPIPSEQMIRASTDSSQSEQIKDPSRNEVIPTYQKFPTKCFGCEREMIRQNMPTYLSHKTKCFQCEKEAISPEMAHFEQPNKCFQCERM